MEDLARKQLANGEKIEKAFSNFKKDGPTRRTWDYLQARLDRLEADWRLFDSCDIQLQDLKEANKEHSYFSAQFYEQVNRVYMDYRRALQAAFEAMELTAGPAKQQNHGGSASEPQQRQLRQMKVLTAALRSFLTDLEDDLTSRRSSAFYRLNIENIRDQWSRISALHLEIISEEIVVDYEPEPFTRLDKRTQSMLIRLQEELDAEAPQQALQHGSPTPTIGSNVINGHIKLPKITLPTFSGSYLQWTQFHNLYVELIHNQNISKAQKMYYLANNLGGEAKALIQHLSMTDDDYDAAWSILESRYGNKRLLVNALINRIMSQPTINQESAAAIRSIHDTTKECVFGLKNLGVSTDSWDAILVFIILKKLDKQTHTLYEQGLEAPRELQSITRLLEFLELRFQALEALGTDKRVFTADQRSFKLKSGGDHRGNTRSSFVTTTRAIDCVVCKKDHPLFACKEFLGQTASNRYTTVKRHNLCINCLKKGHTSSQCTSKTCARCFKRHNTLLHRGDTMEKSGTSQATKEEPAAPKTSASSTIHTTAKTNNSVALAAENRSSGSSLVLLSTALIHLIDNKGQAVELRAVLDSGSQINLITESAAKRLGLKETRSTIRIRSIGGLTQQTHRRVNVLLQSKLTNFTTRLEVFILPQITSSQPAQALEITTWGIPANIQLADPQFHQPDRIDVLIGAEFYFDLLSIGQIKLGRELPVLQNTTLGWIVAGPAPSLTADKAICGISSVEHDDLNQQMEKFWKLEDGDSVAPKMTTGEIKCETHFRHTVKRVSEGRFQVQLPFRHSPEDLGESKDIALTRFLQLERRLAKNSELDSMYRAFIEEYIELGHMTEVNPNQIVKPACYLPHHGVLKPESTTTKLRVVFDASAKTSNNISLNDVLCTGPTIQDELFAILLRFRLPRFVFTADIEKMYRQILVHKADRKYQRILWRNHPGEAIKCYELNTVTYGTTTAPYLATKCLQQLARQSCSQMPLGAAAIQKDFYMDDLMSGSDNLREAVQKQEQIIKILQSAGFNLRKWCANHSELMDHIPIEDRALQLDFEDDSVGHIKTLGLTWFPKTDHFHIKTVGNQSHKVTKRSALSDIAHIFDPLGLMSPVTVTAKIFIQKLWSLKLDWDAALPMDLHTMWINFRHGLEDLNKIKIPRHVFGERVPKNVQLHAFADASEKAYGAVVYIRAEQTAGIRTVRLLCARSRVAPLKMTTIPRLELCAAKIAAELVERLKQDLTLTDPQCFFWTDSEIVLHWLNDEARSFHTFVANRVAIIQERSSPNQWRHVRSKDNPADHLSRGITPEKLESCTAWFYGPMFLHGSENGWPNDYVKTNTDLERKKSKMVLATVQESQHFLHTIDHQNSFERVQRIVAYVLRFTKRIRRDIETSVNNTNLSIKELEQALIVILRETQAQNFENEIWCLKRRQQLSNSNSISSLSPFLDENGLIRVGGRLEASNLSFDAKHPILLPYGNYITRLVLTEIHLKNLHAGPQTLLAIARQRFWPVKGKTTARSIVQHCVRCSRAKPKLMTQLMGNLPASRVQPARPFVNSGVDFAGPLWTHFKVRGKRPQKCYLAVFCCFATKATHLELVTDLTTEAFIGALKRFTGRRGNCRNIYCDNATNFVGARNQLSDWKEAIHSEGAQQKIHQLCATKGTDFHFIPPRAPNFGGLWEAAVKSAKHLLQSQLASVSVTYEELETIIVEIEAILNSRPLTPVSTDPNDVTALTPGHFLIGEPMTSTIDVCSAPARSSLSQRWKMVSEVKYKFWQRWSYEYLSELQHRYKWKQRCENIRPGMMVVLKEDNLPVLKWQLGRVIRGIKGEDGLMRAADVKTTSGVLRRAVRNLAPLPVEEEEEVTSPISTVEPGPSRQETKGKRGADTLDDSPSSADSRTGPTLSRSKHPRYGSALVNLLLLTTLILPIIGEGVQVTPFTTSPGLYVENMGSVNLILNEWKLIVYYDMRPYWKELTSLKFGIDNLNHICEQMHQQPSCSYTVEQFQMLIKEMENNNDFLHHAQKTAKSRNRRGALNIVGNVANALFGVLDSEYAAKMSQVIDTVKGKEDYLLQLLKNQTSLIDSTTNIMIKSEKAIDDQLEDIELTINRSMTHVNNMTHELHDQKTTQLFTSLAVRMMLIVNNYQRVQSALLDVITDTHHGKINPQLLAADQLQGELVSIQENLPSTLRLPSRQNDLLELYKLMTVEGRLSDNHMIFRLKIPLFSYDRFELLHLVPVPLVINDTVMAIQLTTTYMIVSLHRDQYYPLAQHELSACQLLRTSSYMCKQFHPLYRKGSNISACEINLISHIAPQRNCAISPLRHPPRWTQLLRPNQWIYYIYPKATINIFCDDTISQMVLENSGIITLPDTCAIKEEFVTIQAHKLFPSFFNTSFIATQNLTNVIIPVDDNELSYNHHPRKNYTREFQEIESRIHLIQAQQEAEPESRELHQFIVSYLGLGLCLALTVYLLWTQIKQRYKNKDIQRPTPTPRTLPAEAFRLSTLQDDELI